LKIRQALADIKYELAEVVFAKELDETHRRAFNAGVVYATRKISFEADLNLEKIIMTKTEKKGYEKCLQIVQDAKTKLKFLTGAPL
jgi:hypothetical protein